MMDLSLRTRLPVAPPARDGAASAPTTRDGVDNGVAFGATVVEAAGELDLHSAPQMRAELARAIESSAKPRILVDLSGVGFIDSTGVGVLVGALKRAREAGGALHFCGAQSRVRRVFEITGLIGAIPLYDTREAALTGFASSPQTSESANVSASVAAAGAAQ